MRIWQYIPSLSFGHMRQQSTESVRLKKPNNVEYMLLTKSPIASNNINVVKCKILKDNPTDVWIEPDIKTLNWWVPPDDGFIYINFSTTVIFVNNNSDIFAALYEEFIKTDRKCRWMFPQLTRLKARFKLIPDGNFVMLFRQPGEKCEFQNSNNECKLNILKRDGSLMKFLIELNKTE
jgi:hypothetical protein